MSDISDVLYIVAAQVSGFVYPNGTGQPSVTGGVIRVFPGWPAQAALDQDLANGITNVSVYPSGPEVNRTRYSTEQHVLSVAQATISLVDNGDGTLTIGGSVPSPFSMHNLAVLIQGQAFIYPVQPSDTLTSIAAGLASLLAAKYPGITSSGPVITLTQGVRASAVRVGTSGQVGTEWERQMQRVQVTVWAPTPDARNQVSTAIRTAFAKITFLSMPDGFGAWIKPAGSQLMDSLQKAVLYRRDLFFEIEYPTTTTQTIATVVAHKTQYQAPDGSPLLISTR